METILTILCYTIPSLLILISFAIILRKMLNNEREIRNFYLRKQTHEIVTPIRLRAYERLVLLLQRTQPTSILMRQNLNKMTVLRLQTELLKQIREEFEHNAAQQIYVSQAAWTLVSNAKESLINLVNVSAAQYQPTDPALPMAQLLIKAYGDFENPPSEVALKYLRDEVTKNF